MENKTFQKVVFILIAFLIIMNIIESLFLYFHNNKHEARTTRIAASIIGMLAGVISALHGYAEILHHNLSLIGFLFEANTGRLLINLPTSEWTGWIALTVVPNFLITGVLAIIISMIVATWALFFIREKNAGLILIILSLLLIPFGGGFIPPVFGIIAGVIGMGIKHKKQLSYQRMQTRTLHLNSQNT